MSMPGPFELILIFLAVLLIFGAKRIPEIAKGLGKGIREFKDATTDIKRELTTEDAPHQIHPPRPHAQQGYAQQPFGQNQPAPITSPQQGQQQAPPPEPQAPPSSLTEPAYPQGTSYNQPAPDGTINTPQTPPHNG